MSSLPTSNRTMKPPEKQLGEWIRCPSCGSSDVEVTAIPDFVGLGYSHLLSCRDCPASHTFR